MLPVRVKVLSSSSCSLSQASSLLQRFLSGDACSESLARDYVANVAQALQDSISRRAGESGARLKELIDGTQSISATPSSANASLKKQKSHAGKHVNGKLSSISAIDYGKAVGSAIQEAENSHKRHKKKRRYSALENGTEDVFESIQEAGDSAIVHHDKKRRKKEKADLETEHLSTGNTTPGTEKSRKKEKHDKMIEPFGTDNVTPGDQKRRKKHKNDREGEHSAIENVTPGEERRHEKKKRKDRQEADNNSIEPASPAPNDKKSYEKSKRKKEKQSKDAENMETLHVLEFVNPPTESSVKKKRHAGSLEATRVTDSLHPVPPLSPSVNEREGSSKKKRKEKAGVLVTPDKNADITMKAIAEALPVNFDNIDSEEKKRKKNKTTRKVEP